MEHLTRTGWDPTRLVSNIIVRAQRRWTTSMPFRMLCPWLTAHRELDNMPREHDRVGCLGEEKLFMLFCQPVRHPTAASSSQDPNMTVASGETG